MLETIQPSRIEFLQYGSPDDDIQDFSKWLEVSA